MNSLTKFSMQLVLAPENHPGQCLMLGRENAQLTIALRSAVQPTAFTIHHVAPNLTFETRSAPRHIVLEGCLSRGTAEEDSLLQQ